MAQGFYDLIGSMFSAPDQWVSDGSYRTTSPSLPANVPTPMSVRGLNAVGDFIPGYGDVKAIGEAGQALSQGELLAAGLLGTCAAIGLVPGAGDALARPVIAAGRRVADAVPSEAIYAGRSLAEGDFGGVFDAFTPGRPAQSLSAMRVYHGSDVTVPDPKPTLDPEGLLEGFSVTRDKGVAEQYARLRGGSAVSEYDIDPSRLNAIKEYDLYDLVDAEEVARGLDEGDLTGQQILEILKSKGINAIEYQDPEFGIRVLDTSILKPPNPITQRGDEILGLEERLSAKYPKADISLHGDPSRGYELSRIVVPDRGKGTGTEIMNDLVRAADDQGARVSLTPDTSFGGSSVSRLKDFYKRFGFVENRGRNKDFSIRNTMYREPKGLLDQ